MKVAPKSKVYMIQPIEPEPTQEGEEPSKRMAYADPLTDEDGEPLIFHAYTKARAEAERRGYDHRNVTLRTIPE